MLPSIELFGVHFYVILILEMMFYKTYAENAVAKGTTWTGSCYSSSVVIAHIAWLIRVLSMEKCVCGMTMTMKGLQEK